MRQIQILTAHPVLFVTVLLILFYQNKGLFQQHPVTRRSLLKSLDLLGSSGEGRLNSTVAYDLGNSRSICYRPYVSPELSFTLPMFDSF